MVQKNEDLGKRFEKLSDEFKALQESNKRTEEELGCMTKDYEMEVNENKELREYIQKIGILDNCENTGKDIAN